MLIEQAKLERTLLEMRGTHSEYAYAYGSLSALLEAYLDGHIDRDRLKEEADCLSTALLNVMDPLGPGCPPESPDAAAGHA